MILDTLTERERAIAALVVLGLSNRQIEGSMGWKARKSRGDLITRPLYEKLGVGGLGGSGCRYQARIKLVRKLFGIERN